MEKKGIWKQLRGLNKRVILNIGAVQYINFVPVTLPGMF